MIDYGLGKNGKTVRDNLEEIQQFIHLRSSHWVNTHDVTRVKNRR